MNMSKVLKRLMLSSIAACALAGTSASAYVLDSLVASAALKNSGDKTELDWIKSMVDVSGDFVKVTDSAVVLKADPSQAGQWYIDVGVATPGYFMLKFGAGGRDKDAADHFLFANIGELGKLVFNDEQVDYFTGGCGSGNCNAGRLSHYAYIGTGEDSAPGNGGQVPEPASVALIGLGLAGLALRRRG